jgi:hypothetical protein
MILGRRLLCFIQHTPDFFTQLPDALRFLDKPIAPLFQQFRGLTVDGVAA